MIKSMTGYGRAQALVGGWDITLELRGVNHRFLELSFRLPRSCGHLEDKLKTLIQGEVFRGKVEVNLGLQRLETTDAQVEVDLPLAQSYHTALRQLATGLGLREDIAVSSFLRFPDIFVLRRPEQDPEELWQAVSGVAQQALQAFVEMRRTEGQRLRADILARLDTIAGLVAQVEEQSPRTTEAYRNRLYQRLQEVLGQSGIEEQRILAEAAVFSEKTAVDEETVRLASHISQLRSILESPEAIGRKLDFLVQEMGRETNTIGSKAQDIAISKIVVEMKSELEKIREQVQNIE